MSARLILSEKRAVRQGQEWSERARGNQCTLELREASRRRAANIPRTTRAVDAFHAAFSVHSDHGMNIEKILNRP